MDLNSLTHQYKKPAIRQKEESYCLFLYTALVSYSSCDRITGKAVSMIYNVVTVERLGTECQQAIPFKSLYWKPEYVNHDKRTKVITPNVVITGTPAPRTSALPGRETCARASRSTTPTKVRVPCQGSHMEVSFCETPCHTKGAPSFSRPQATLGSF